MEIKHEKCGHEWNYKGNSTYYITCPNCYNKVRINPICKETVGRIRCNQRSYAGGYCKQHYHEHFNNEKGRFGKWAVK